MEYAIIAAGEGSRLKKEGFQYAKPLVKLRQNTLIERLIEIFARNNATSVHIIINEFSPELSRLLEDIETEVPLNVITKSTLSSLHSFSEILPLVKGNKVCLTTVDTVFEEREFEAYIKKFEQAKHIDALMAVTDYVDDESPLYVATDNSMHILNFYDQRPEGVKYISGGIYCFNARVFPMVAKAMAGNISRMRNFQRMLVSEGLYLQAYPFTKIIDIDHVTDIEKARKFLQETAAV